MNTYKLRYESTHDVIQFLLLATGMAPVYYVDDPDYQSGDELTFRTAISLHILLDLTKKVPDGHCMTYTLALIEDYTGDEIIRK